MSLLSIRALASVSISQHFKTHTSFLIYLIIVSLPQDASFAPQCSKLSHIKMEIQWLP